jgi:hypothetical protein
MRGYRQVCVENEAERAGVGAERGRTAVYIVLNVPSQVQLKRILPRYREKQS